MLLDVLLLDPLLDKDVPSMFRRAKEEVWKERDAVADQEVEIINKNQLRLRELERSNMFIVHISHVKKTTWEEMERGGRQPVPRARKDPDLESESANGRRKAPYVPG